MGSVIIVLWTLVSLSLSQLMVAVCDYTPSIDSPNPQPYLELPFSKGKIITVYGNMVRASVHNCSLNEFIVFNEIHNVKAHVIHNLIT